MILETYTRIFTGKEQLDQTVTFHCRNLDGKETLRFDLGQPDLTLVQVTSEKLSVLVIAGTSEARAPFERTKLTIRVDNLKRQQKILLDLGARQLEDISVTPVGWKTRFEHPDGMVVVRWCESGNETTRGELSERGGEGSAYMRLNPSRIPWNFYMTTNGVWRSSIE